MERVLYQPWRTHTTTSGCGAASGSTPTPVVAEHHDNQHYLTPVNSKQTPNV